MRIRLFVALVLLATAVRAADPSRVTCMPEAGYANPSGGFPRIEERLVAIDADAFRARYGAFPKQTFGAIEVRTALVATKDAEADPADRELRAGFAVRGGGAAKYYELVDREGGAIGVENDARAVEEQAKEPRIVVASAGDPSLPLLRFEWTGSYRGGHSSGSTRDVLFLDFRGTPSIAQHAQCTDGWTGGGACSAADLVYSPYEGYDCAWDLALGDVVCRDLLRIDGEWTRRSSTRRFALYAHKELPVREQSVPSLEALARGPRGTHFVEGVGLVKPVGTIAKRWFVYVATGTSHQLVARLWSVDLRDPAGPILPLPVQLLDDPGDEDDVHPDLEDDEHLDLDGVVPKSWMGKPAPRFTPDAPPFAIETTRLTPAGNSPDVLQLVLHDGKGRGVFWIGGDAASGVLSALRVASDVGEYTRCNRFAHPSAAVANDIVAAPFSASLTVRPRWEEELSDQEPVAPELPPERAIVTWQGGFDVEPAH